MGREEEEKNFKLKKVQLKKPSQQTLMISWTLREIWSIFILALIQTTVHQMLIFCSLMYRIF